jgi:outer membrane protein insertion porin family
MLKVKIQLLLLTIVCTFLSAFPLFGQSKVENQIVGKLDIVIATESLGASRTGEMIKARLKTREGDIFSQTAFDNDLKMLIQDYDRVEPFVELSEGKIYITLKIWAKPTIRTIRWEGNRRLKSSKLQSELGIRQGSVFDRQQFNKAFHQLKTYYIKEGFFEAQLDYDIEYDPSCNEVDVVIRLEEGRAGKIKRIVFCNFTKCEEEELLEMMATKKYNFFLSWLTGEGLYSDEMIQHDKFVILSYLQNHGFADARVDIDVCEANENNRINLYIKVDRGAKYYFGNVSIEGNELYSEDEILECLLIKSGCPFSPEKIHQSIEKITNKYGRCGYIEAVINYEPKLSESECVYDIKLSIDEGDQYRVGMIKVMGNCSTQTKVILHETLLIPGEVFNLEKLKITEARLCNIGYFKHVNVYAVKSEGDSVLPGNYRDVHIEVEEANTGHLGAFFGFSSAENVFGGVNITERNFNARGLCHFWQDGFRGLRGGGEYAHFTISIGSKTSSYVLSWTKPHFNDTPWAVGFDIEKGYNQYIADDYEIYTYGFNIHGHYQYNPFLKVGIHYRLKYADIHVDDDDDDVDNCKKLKKQARNDGLISAVGLTWLYDSTNHPVKPSRGLKSRIEGEIAGLGGDRSFVSVGYLNSYYYDLWGCGVLKFRGDLKFIQPIGETNADDIPLDERFFLGGDNTVRGYQSYRLGPKFCGEDDNPKGGISMQLFSIEYSKQVFSFFDPFIFIDTGSLSMDKWTFSKFYHSAGYGARVKLLEGMPPLTLGMGYPFNPKHNGDVKKFFISVGGKF